MNVVTNVKYPLWKLQGAIVLYHPNLIKSVNCAVLRTAWNFKVYFVLIVTIISKITDGQRKFYEIEVKAIRISSSC